MAGASNTGGQALFVLDGSVALSWCFPDEGTRDARRLLERLRAGAAAVPALWFLEVANALLAGEGRGRLSQAETAEALRLLGQLPLRVDDRAGQSFAAEVLALARQHSLSAYDAAYLELAIRLHLPLATFDRSLRAAAKAAGVALHPA